MPSADLQRSAVLELHHVASVGERLELRKEVDIDDDAAVDANESMWIEPPFKRRQRLSRPMCLMDGVHANVVVSGLDPLDLICVQQYDAPPRSHHYPPMYEIGPDGQSRNRIPAGRRLRAKASAFKGFLEPLIVEWLHEVIKRFHLERPNRVLVVSGHKHYGSRLAPTNLPQHVKPVDIGHLHVEKDDVGSLASNRPDSLSPTGALRDGRDIRLGRKVSPQLLAGQPLIIHDQHVECAHATGPLPK
jgi:hypothetical protein